MAGITTSGAKTAAPASAAPAAAPPDAPPAALARPADAAADPVGVVEGGLSFVVARLGCPAAGRPVTGARVNESPPAVSPEFDERENRSRALLARSRPCVTFCCPR